MIGALGVESRNFGSRNDYSKDVWKSTATPVSIEDFEI